jgi:hypothetical protein
MNAGRQKLLNIGVSEQVAPDVARFTRLYAPVSPD